MGVGPLMEMGREASETNKAKGWYACSVCFDQMDEPPGHICGACGGTRESPMSVPESLMLIVSEVSEALLPYRNNEDLKGWEFHEDDSGEKRKPEGFPIELADIIIRTVAMAHRMGIDLDEAVKVKMEYNWKRPYRHGNKKC